MAQEDNFFALLAADEEGGDISKLIDSVKQEEEKIQKEKKEEKKMAHQVPTDMRAKRIVLPSHVRSSFIVFDKKKEREKAEAEARRKAEEEAKAKNSMEISGDQQWDCGSIGGMDDKSGEQPVKGNFIASNNSNGWQQSATLNSYQGGHRGGNGYHRKNGDNYNYQRNNNGGANVYQQSNGYNGYYEGNLRRANGYQPNNSGQYHGSYKGSNGNRRYNQKNNGVPNGEDPSGNVADDGWQYVGRRHESLEESKNSEKDSGKSVNGDNGDDINENKDIVGQQAVDKNEVQGYFLMTTEGQEDDQSEKKSKKKNTKKETRDLFEKKYEKKEEGWKNLMTLEVYEKKKLEDRKILEAFKRPEQRKVEDKDFESMQLIGKKKEQKSEGKLKKKDSIKEEKVRKTLSINEFLKPAEGTYLRQRWNGDRPYERMPNGRFAGERPAGHGPVPSAPLDPPPHPSFDFENHQFPALRGNGKT